MAHKKVITILFILIFFQAVITLSVTNPNEILGGDGNTYHTLALNIFNNNVFSDQSNLPLEPTITRTPGYPFILGLLYKISNNSFTAVRLFQFLLFFGTSSLIFFLAQNLFSNRIALFSSLLCATYLPLVFINLQHLTESITTFGVVLLIFLLNLIKSRFRSLTIIIIGIIQGGIVIIRPSFGLLIAFVLIYIYVFLKITLKEKIVSTIILLSTLTIVILPWGIRNYLVSNKLVPLSVSSGWSLYLSIKQYKGDYSYGIPVSDWTKIIEDHELRFKESKKELLTQTSITNQSKSLTFLRPEIEYIQDENYKKDAIQLISSYKMSNLILSYPERIAYLYSTCDTSPTRIYHWIHFYVQLQYLIMIFLIFIGVLFQKHSLSAEAILWIVPIYLLTIHSVFHIEPRYSLPARPFLLIYAGIGLNIIFGWIYNFIRK